MADIKFGCPRCGQNIAIGKKHAGVTVPCPTCNKMLVVPASNIVHPTQGKQTADQRGGGTNATLQPAWQKRKLADVNASQVSDRKGAIEMDIEFDCNYCGQHVAIEDSGAGLVVQCPKCKQDLVVPSAEASDDIIGDDNKSSASLNPEFKKCPFCAELIKKEAKVCRFCGRDLVKRYDNINSQRQDFKIQGPQTSHSQKSGANPALIMLGLVLLLGGPGFGYYTYTNSQKQVDLAEERRHSAVMRNMDGVVGTLLQGGNLDGVMREPRLAREEKDRLEAKADSDKYLAIGLAAGGVVLGIGCFAAGRKNGE